jgi:excisionase family DNA binding protein
MMPTRPRKTTPDPMPDREILNIDGAAAFLGVSVKTFSKVLREGDVPGRKVGREWKFSRQALIDWVGGSRSRAFLEAGDADEPVPPPAPARAPRRARAASAGRERPGPRRSKPVDDFSVDEI